MRMKKWLIHFFILLALLFSPDAWAGNIDDVTFLTKVQSYEAIVNTTLITQEGKRLPIERGTKLNVAGFTRAEAFVISRTDKPNGFVRREDIAPMRR